jgi:hypothetical protein
MNRRPGDGGDRVDNFARGIEQDEVQALVRKCHVVVRLSRCCYRRGLARGRCICVF